MCYIHRLHRGHWSVVSTPAKDGLRCFTNGLPPVSPGLLRPLWSGSALLFRGRELCRLLESTHLNLRALPGADLLFQTPTRPTWQAFTRLCGLLQLTVFEVGTASPPLNTGKTVEAVSVCVCVTPASLGVFSYPLSSYLLHDEFANQAVQHL